MHDTHEIKRAVRERYAASATQGTSCCGDSACCGSAPSAELAEQIGYTKADLENLPDGADLGLGCGNPLGILDLNEGETVLDLGSGAGIDCFIAAKRVGPSGRVIGVDMTPEMLDRARANAKTADCDNVEFRLGEIEHLPVADAAVDAVISNCVINLVPDKRQAFAETFRVLRPGGRLSVSDIVTAGAIPDVVRESAEAYVACLAGAIDRDEYLAFLGEAGFTDVHITSEQTFAEFGEESADEIAERFGDFIEGGAELVRELAPRFASIRVQATKPAEV